MRSTVKLTLLFACVCADVLAQVPGILSFQGRVTVNGTNFDGTGQFKFALVDAGRFIERPPLPPLIFHTTYWSHDGSSSAGSAPTSSVPVTVSRGLYSVMLGDSAVPGMLQSIPPAVFTNTQVFLRVWFDDGANGLARLTPDQRIGANAYALKAAGVDAGAVTSEMIAQGAVGTAALADGAVTGGKIQAGSVKLSQIDDGGGAEFQRFQEVAQSFDGTSPLAFADLLPVATTNGSSAAFSLRVQGAGFGTVVGFSGSEELARPFAYVVQVRYSGEAVNPNSQIGVPASLALTRDGRTTRFSGVVTASSISGSASNGLLYTLRLEPSLAYLGLNSDYRVNQGKSVPEVAAALYQGIVGSAPVQSLSGTHERHDCLIQYSETALNFFNRLLEYEGISYFFDHRDLPPGLIMADNVEAYPTSPNSPFAYFGDTATNPPATAEYIRTFQNAVRQSTLRSSVNAYNFEMPSNSLLAGEDSAAGGTGETYEFGGPPGAARPYYGALAKWRAERQATERSRIAGSSLVPDLRAGYKFVLVDQSGAGLGNSYLVTSVRHAGFVRVTNGVSTCFYGNRFEVIPASVPFRPALRTPRPQAQACTAVVTGPAGEEIYTDKYGRIKVQFHWDRHGVKDQNSSAWLRVASPWAGNSFGVIFLPRIGHEVLVEFVQGNPDQPVVVGSLYNNELMPPYPLPANQTVSTIKTRSSKGGALDSGNEIKFEDKKGSEVLQLTAEKDFTLSAKNDVTLGGGNDTLLDTANNLQAVVGNDAFLTASHDLALGAANNLSLSGNSLSVSAGQSTFSGQSAFAGPVTISNSVQAFGSFTMNQSELYLKDDNKHGLGYYGAARLFAGVGPDGPVLYGYSGGALGTVTFTESRVALNWNNSGNVSIGSTSSPASTLDVHGTATVRSNLVVHGSFSNATPFYASGSLLGARSIIVNAPSIPSVAANTWTKVGDVGSFTKSAAGSLLELTFNSRLCVNSWGPGATGANFELRIDNTPVSSGVARATVVPSDNANYGVWASITGIFTGLSAGSHTVSIWVYSYNGTAAYPTVNPGNFTAPHLVVKEFK